MPRKPAAKLTLKEREKWFISLYVKAGAIDAKIASCERRALLKPGSGSKILARKSVQQDIKARMESVGLNQVFQQAASKGVAVAKQAIQQDLIAKVKEIKRMKIELDVLDDQLMQGVVGLPWDVFPKEKLDAIKAAYVVFGTLESGNTRRLIPPENATQESVGGVYTSLFQKLALNPSRPQNTAVVPTEQVYELFPKAPGQAPAVISSDTPLPPPGESIDEVPVKKPTSNIITVEVG